MKKFFLWLCFSLSMINLEAQNVAEERMSTWKGFEKVSFTIDSLPAYYVKPAKAIPGNPWIWRAYFPEWHTDMDSILLTQGFHVAYINTSNLFGHAKAMMAWDDLYRYLVMQKGFATKPALEGVSRGGLYVYGWAKRNPDKVSCIYAEAPVCDFTSWPGGKGKGKGSAKDWKMLLDVYGFTETQAIHYDDQPKDHLETLAAFKVPLLHVIGLKDSIVPNEENTFVLVNNYIKAGGSATVVPMTAGKQELSGHHFPIADPAQLARWIYQYAVPVARPLRAEDFQHAYGGLENILFRIREERKATVAFLGGSITNMNGWRNAVMQWLQERFPETVFTFINAGIPSLGSVPHAFRLQQDVLSKGRVDLMFVESAVNDKANKTSVLQQRRAMEGIIRHALAANPFMNMVVMAFVDEAKIADYAQGIVPDEVAVHDDMARHYRLPFINLAEEVAKRIEHKEFNWEDDFRNIHPSPFGQQVYFSSIKTLLQDQFDRDVPVKLQEVSLPSPLQQLIYANGDYVAIGQTKNRKNFWIDPSWHPSDSAKTRAGFVQVPMIVGEKPGASFDLEFTGRSVGIAVVAGPDAGRIIYGIDGREKKELETYNRYSSNLHLPQYFILGDDLKNGRHKLHVEIAEGHHGSSKGNAVRIVYFLVNGNDKGTYNK